MAKTIKFIELLKETAEGNNISFKKDGGTYIDSLWTYLFMFTTKRKSFDEIEKWLNSEVEIIEKQQDIDTLNPEEVYFKDGTELVYKLMYDKINEIAMKVNKQERKINELKEYKNEQENRKNSTLY